MEVGDRCDMNTDESLPFTQQHGPMNFYEILPIPSIGPNEPYFASGLGKDDAEFMGEKFDFDNISNLAKMFRNLPVEDANVSVANTVTREHAVKWFYKRFGDAYRRFRYKGFELLRPLLRSDAASDDLISIISSNDKADEFILFSFIYFFRTERNGFDGDRAYAFINDALSNRWTISQPRLALTFAKIWSYI